MWICLDFINENESVFSFLHLVAGEHTDLQIEIINGSSLRKQAIAKRVLHHIDFNYIFK